ncbi:MAG TPA: ABC transporter ATP-binding protein [Homoserinimonas sp.]|nr:ABC transporter ATP-binding protein [Homoserinimonas sp.]
MTITQTQRTDQKSGLSLDNLTKSFAGNTVLKNLSIELEAGKLLSLLGPSGCGKTTTLNMIAGFLQPDSGSIRLAGEDITRIAPNKRDTAIVFQNYALFPHMSVFDNVSYGLKVRKLARPDLKKRTTEMLEMLDITRLADRYPGQLSGGQQQRVSLARALAVQPSLLLLDEPLSNLDAKLRQDIRVEIRRFQQELDQTAVFVTHDQDEALAISDYIAVLNLGWLEQIGTPEELWAKPKTVYVADFMGVENILPVAYADGVSKLTVDGQNAGRPVPSVRSDCRFVGFRPGKARLAAPAEHPSSSLSLSGVVLAETYMGTGYRYKVAAGLSKPLTVDQPGALERFAVGDDVQVLVDAPELLPLAENHARQD